MDLQKLYGKDEKKANDGVWLEVGDGAVLCRYYNVTSPRTIAISQRRTRKYQQAIRNKSLSPEIDRRVGIEIFVEAAVIDWRGINMNGDALAFSFDNAVKAFYDYPEFMMDIVQQATELSNFRDIEEDEKN